ncbi:MAG: AAA family ATPase, partial [Clostridia bacterium]|nr:AAA family ATPase [Clostridia bacterium]
VELPDETGGFDVWGLKLSKQCAPLLKEWPDALLFINYKTYVVATDTNSHKAQGGKRVIYTSHSPVWDAKNRHSLPEEMDLCYESIAPIFAGAADTVKTTSAAQTQQSPPAAQKLEPVSPDTLAIIYQWMEKAGIEAREVQSLVARKGHFPPKTTIEEYPEKFVHGWLMKNWDQVVTTIQNDPEHVPF